jgi:hypothetical protein
MDLMEEFQQYRGLAAKNIRAAEHILNVTYQLVEDTRLLLGVAENIAMAAANTMYSLVSYERLYRRIPPYLDNFDSRYSVFRIRIATRYNLDDSYMEFVKKMKDIIQHHKESPIEFARKGKFVICSEGWKIETIGTEQLKQYIYKAKEFFDLVNRITSKHESIFNK